MTNTLLSPPFAAVVRELLDASAREEASTGRPSLPPGVPSWDDASAADLARAYEDYYIAVSPEAGHLLYALARAIRPRTVVEFGTSYGISTLYLAAALTDNGAGQVISTELSAKKAAAARASLDEAGVGAAATILAGDARETLATVPGPVELVLLDGWKDLCLPVLRLLEPRLAAGALVAADDITHDTLAPYLSYVRDPGNGYVSVAFPVADGVELSSWTR